MNGGGVVQRMVFKDLTQPQKDYIVLMYKAGEPNASIESTCRVTMDTVYRVVDEAGIPRRPRGGRKVMGPSGEVEVIRRYQMGDSTQEIGDALGVSRKAISRILAENGIPRRGNQSKPGFDVAEMCMLYRGGMSGVALADRYNVTQTTIYNHLRSNGVKRRNRGGR